LTVEDVNDAGLLEQRLREEVVRNVARTAQDVVPSTDGPRHGH